jgi:hypothetical protein
MASVKITPTKDRKRPYDMADAKPTTFVEELQVAADTADLLEAMGAPIEVAKGDEERQAKLLEEAIRNKKASPLSNLPVAISASSFLRSYGQMLAFDAAQARAAITNKLMEIADCGDIKFELKALEMLGKHSDIGLFTERSEITINYKDPEALENAIKERVKRLLNADIIDITPLGRDLDDEFGIASITDAEFDEVSSGDEEGEDDPHT